MRSIKLYFPLILFAVVIAMSQTFSGCVPFDEGGTSDDPCVLCEQQKKQYVPPTTTTYVPPTYTPPTNNPPPVNYTPVNTVIQIGAFVNKTYADNFISKARANLTGYFLDMKWNKKGFYQIVTGEYNNLGKAEQGMAFVLSKGYSDAFIKETKYLQ